MGPVEHISSGRGLARRGRPHRRGRGPGRGVYTYRFAGDGAVITSDPTLRFRSREEVESSLAACGYHVVEVLALPTRTGWGCPAAPYA
jgi:hypothetical protein